MVALDKYARLMMPSGGADGGIYGSESRVQAFVPARGVPVYNRVFRIVDREVVMADIRQQVSAGAQHLW
jgi:hypothetical protein